MAIGCKARNPESASDAKELAYSSDTSKFTRHLYQAFVDVPGSSDSGVCLYLSTLRKDGLLQSNPVARFAEAKPVTTKPRWKQEWKQKSTDLVTSIRVGQEALTQVYANQAAIITEIDEKLSAIYGADEEPSQGSNGYFGHVKPIGAFVHEAELDKLLADYKSSAEISTAPDCPSQHPRVASTTKEAKLQMGRCSCSATCNYYYDTTCVNCEQSKKFDTVLTDISYYDCNFTKFLPKANAGCQAATPAGYSLIATDPQLCSFEQN